MGKIKIMLVEDHLLVRQGTKELLDRESDLRVVAEAGDGEEAVRLAAQVPMDVIVMDVAMPRMNGVEATQQLKAKYPGVAVLVLSAYDDDEYVLALLEAGAAGYLLKDVSCAELARSIRAVCAGEAVLHPTIMGKMIDYVTGPQARRHAAQDAEPPPVELTDRELEALQLAALGLTNREIATRMQISSRTVQVHLSNVFGKLGVGSRTEAVVCGLQRGWLTLDDTR